jgi:hypothetical protein
MATLPPSENAGFGNENPYAAPSAPLAGVEPLDLGGEQAEVEAIRRTYLSHESSVRSVGSLHYLGAIFTGLGTVAVIITAATTEIREGMPILVMSILFYAALTGLHVALGIGLNRLQTWARWTEVTLISLSLALMLFASIAIVLLTMGGQAGTLLPVLFGYGFMGLILVYILYLLVSRKGSMVFSPEYRAIVERTPHIKYKTSLLVKVFLVLIVSLIVLGFFAAYFAARR